MPTVKTPEELEKERQSILDSITNQNIEEQTKDVPADGTIKMTDAETAQAISDANASEPKPDVVRESIKGGYENQSNQFDNIIRTMQLDKIAHQTATKEAEKNNRRAQLFGGVAEAASSLVNLFGTMAGAAPQKWDSPQPGWQSRVDTITRERDAKLESYKNSLNSLRMQKASLDNAKNQALINYDQQKQKLAIEQENAAFNRKLNEVKLSMEMEKSIISKAQQIWKQTNDKARAAISIQNSYRKEMGREISENELNRLLGQAYEGESASSSKGSILDELKK